jgi:hypothetical protein
LLQPLLYPPLAPSSLAPSLSAPLQLAACTNPFPSLPWVSSSPPGYDADWGTQAPRAPYGTGAPAFLSPVLASTCLLARERFGFDMLLHKRLHSAEYTWLHLAVEASLRAVSAKFLRRG